MLNRRKIVEGMEKLNNLEEYLMHYKLKKKERMPPKARISLYIDLRLYDILTDICNERNISYNHLITEYLMDILRDHLEKKKKEV